MVAVKQIFDEIIQTKHKVITEESSKSILKTYGVKVPPFALVTSAEDAVKQAKKSIARGAAKTVPRRWQLVANAARAPIRRAQ